MFCFSLTLSLLGSSVLCTPLSLLFSPSLPSCRNATFAFRFCRRQFRIYVCIMSELKWRRCHLNTWHARRGDVSLPTAHPAHPSPTQPSPQEQLSSVCSLSVSPLALLSHCQGQLSRCFRPAFHPAGSMLSAASSCTNVVFALYRTYQNTFVGFQNF